MDFKELNHLNWFLNFKDQMQSLEKNKIISNLSCHPKIASFYFNLGRIREISGIRLYEDFSKYKFKIEMDRQQRPSVYPRPIIKSVVNFKNHINGDNTLCLYHTDDFNWSNHQRLDEYIVPWIYTWQLYYNEWKLTDIWPGPEYPHQTK